MDILIVYREAKRKKIKPLLDELQQKHGAELKVTGKDTCYFTGCTEQHSKEEDDGYRIAWLVLPSTAENKKVIQDLANSPAYIKAHEQVTIYDHGKTQNLLSPYRKEQDFMWFYESCEPGAIFGIDYLHSNRSIIQAFQDM